MKFRPFILGIALAVLANIAPAYLYTPPSAVPFAINSTSVSNGVTGSGAVVLATAPTIAFANLSFTGNGTFGDAAADVLTFNSGAWTLSNNVVATRAVGAAAAGGSVNVDLVSTATGDAGGASTITAVRSFATYSGAANLAETRAVTGINFHSGSGLMTTQTGVTAALSLMSTGNTTSSYGMRSAFSLNAAGSIGTAIGYAAIGATFASTGAIDTHIGFDSAGLGHATLVTNAIGFRAQDITAGPTFAAGFQSQVSSGSGRWGFYSSGTGNNGYLGSSIFGDATTAPDRIVTIVNDGLTLPALRQRSQRAAITSSAVIGGMDFMSNDTSLTAPGSLVANIQALATQTHDGSNLGTRLSFSVTGNTTTTPFSALSLNAATGTNTAGFLMLTALANGAPSISVSSSDTNNDLQLTAKGTGKVRVGTASTATASGTGGTSTATCSADRCVITSAAITTAALANHVMTVTNTHVAATDIVHCSIAGGSNSAGTPSMGPVVSGAGSFTAQINNLHTVNAFNGTIIIACVVF